MQFGDEAVERRLRALVAGAGVTHNASGALKTAVARPDAVTETSLFANFGKQATAHAAAEHFDRHAHGVIIGIRLRHRRPGDADVRLLALLILMKYAAGRRLSRKRSRRFAVPISKRALSQF